MATPARGPGTRGPSLQSRDNIPARRNAVRRFPTLRRDPHTGPAVPAWINGPTTRRNPPQDGALARRGAPDLLRETPAERAERIAREHEEEERRNRARASLWGGIVPDHLIRMTTERVPANATNDLLAADMSDSDDEGNFPILNHHPHLLIIVPRLLPEPSSSCPGHLHPSRNLRSGVLHFVEL